MKTFAIAAAFAAGALMTVGLGTASADIIQVEGSYSTPEACQADGPHVQITENDGAYSKSPCHQGADGRSYRFPRT